MEKINSIGTRLVYERKRLGYTQLEFATLGGVVRHTVALWEKDRKFPNAEFLAKIAELGVDINYVITGNRSKDDQLPSREKALLDNYRATDEEGRRLIERLALAVSKPDVTAESAEKKARGE